MKRIAAVLALSIGMAGCAPVAVGCIVAGVGSLAEAKALSAGHCAGDGCGYLGLCVGAFDMLGAMLVAGGGIGLLANH